MPFVLRVPELGITTGSIRSNSIIELVDVFPTLCDLAAIECPQRAWESLEGEQLDSRMLAGTEIERSYGLREPPLAGRSLVPLLRSLTSGSAPPVKAQRRAALSFHGRCAHRDAPGDSLWCIYHDAEWETNQNLSVVGMSARSRHYRLVVWAKWNKHRMIPLLSNSVAEHARRAEVELYICEFSRLPAPSAAQTSAWGLHVRQPTQ